MKFIETFLSWFGGQLVAYIFAGTVFFVTGMFFLVDKTRNIFSSNNSDENKILSIISIFVSLYLIVIGLYFIFKVL